jgi:hypothetical protein
MLPTGGLITIGRRGGSGRRTASKLQGALLYREEQGFGWPWPGMFFVFVGVATLLAVAVPFGLGMWQQLVLGKAWGDKPIPDYVLAAVGPLAILMSLLPLAAVLFGRLRVEVRTDGIRIELVRFRCPQVLRREEVQAATPTHIGPFGGWGASSHGRRLVYRMAGSEGVTLELAGGKKVVIGSEHPRSLQDALRSMLEGKPHP